MEDPKTPTTDTFVFDNRPEFIEMLVMENQKIMKAGTGHPTYIPKTFREQFYFEDNGSSWKYINNVWREFTPI